jgi:cell division protein FtsB
MRIEFRDAELDRLQEERDHLLIRINLMENDPTHRDDILAAAREQLRLLEHDISIHRRPASLGP